MTSPSFLAGLLGHRRASGAVGRVGIVVACVAAALAGPAATAEAQYVCLPTCASNDGRLFLVPGGSGADTFDKNDIALQVISPAASPMLEVGIFDGDTGASDPNGKKHWDQGSVPVLYESTPTRKETVSAIP